jgi:hypothetical protein
LRWRIVLVATAVVAAALAIGSAAFVGVLRESLVAGVQLSAERDAAELVGQVETTGVASVDTDIDDHDGRIVQLASTDGSLLALPGPAFLELVNSATGLSGMLRDRYRGVGTAAS